MNGKFKNNTTQKQEDYPPGNFEASSGKVTNHKWNSHRKNSLNEVIPVLY